MSQALIAGDGTTVDISRCPVHSSSPVATAATAAIASPATATKERATRLRPIPVAQGLPLLGNLAELVTDPLAFFLKSYITHGPVFRVRVPTRAYTVLAGIDASLFLIREDQRLFDHTPIYGQIARELDASHYPIATRGDRHAHLRRAYKPAFSTDVLGAAAPALLGEIGSRTARWAPGERLVVLDLMHELLGDVVVPAVAGRALGDLRRDALTFGRYSMGCGLGGYPSEFRHAPHYLLARRRMLPFFRDVIAWHREHPPGGDRAPDFIDHALAVPHEDGSALTEDNVLALAQTIYSNTLVYVAPAAAFCMYSLLAAPEARERCLQEIDEAFAGGAPDLDRLRAAEYFGAAVKESMRLHPIGLAAPRIVKQPFTFAGCHIAEGEPVLVAVTACHYLSELYPDPYRFEPERHLAPRNESRRPGAFAPFGHGALTCLATRLVESMVQIVVAGLLRHVHMELDVPGYTMKKRVNPFPEPTSELVLRVGGPRLPSA